MHVLGFDHRTNLSALWSHLSATASVAHQKSKTEFLLSSEMATQDESSTSRLEWQRRHEQALRTTAESLQVGRATAQTLSVQAEQLGLVQAGAARHDVVGLAHQQVVFGAVAIS